MKKVTDTDNVVANKATKKPNLNLKVLHIKRVSSHKEKLL